MKISISTLPKTPLIVWTLCLTSGAFNTLQAQNTSSETTLANEQRDTILNMDATYNRPFMTKKKSAVAIGGYPF